MAFQEIRESTRETVNWTDHYQGIMNYQWNSDAPHIIDNTIVDEKIIKSQNIYFLLGIWGTGLIIKRENSLLPDPGNLQIVVSGVGGPLIFPRPGLRLGRAWEIGGTITFSFGYYIPIDTWPLVRSANKDGSQS